MILKKLFSPTKTILAIVVLTVAVLSGTGCAAKPAENRPPVIDQISGSTDWTANYEGQFVCVASDPDGDSLKYSWTADNGTIKGEGDRISWTSPEAMGKYKVTITVSDGKGGEATMTKDIRVTLNADGSITPDAPVVLNMTLPSKDTVTGAKRVRIWTSSPVECKVEGADTSKLKYTWTTPNGKLQAKGLAEGTASRVTWIAPGAAGDFTLDVVVTDNNGNEAKGTVNFKVFCCGN